MKEFNFESRTKFSVKHREDIYNCECPSQEDIVKFADKCDKEGITGSEMLKESGSLLDKCGLPNEVFKKLEIEQVRALMEFIGAKKN